MEDAPELWGWRIWVVSEQTSPTCSYLPLTHVVPISTQRELLPHFPLTQSELSLHNLQAWTPSSLMFGGFIICYILVVLENGDCYWCWNQCWKDACLPACLPEGDGTRQRRTVGCEMEVMVSPSFSSKYYQLVHINKFLLNEHQLPCLSFPASLMYLFTYCSCLRLCFPLSPLLPICLWHQEWLHCLHTFSPVLAEHLPWKTVNASHPHTATMTETHSMASTVPQLQGDPCHQHVSRSHPEQLMPCCTAGASLCWGCCLSRSQVHVVTFCQSSKEQISYVKTLTKPSLNSYKASEKVFTWKNKLIC